MQVFEFHFNPKRKEDLVFDSFCYEPENIYERRVGSLYMVGNLKNVLPKNNRFLDNLSSVIKEKYYSPKLHLPENSLKESLRTANDHLERIAKSSDVSWLGNLSFAVLSLRNFELNFTKVGDLKILLLRGRGIIDIDEKLKLEEIDPYPLKIFGNIAFGKLAENDLILVLTKEVFDYCQSKNLLDKIAEIVPFDGEKLRGIFNHGKEDLLNISGVCLVIALTKETLIKKRESILPQQKRFSLKEAFTPIINYIKKLIKKPKLRLPHPSIPKLTIHKPAIPKIIIPKLNIKIPFMKEKMEKRIKTSSFKNIIIILVLIFLLVLGSFVFQKEKEQQLKEYQTTLSQIQEKVSQAENLLLLKESRPEAQKQANLLLKESWDEILPLTKIQNLPLKEQALAIQETMKGYLESLNRMKIIEEPLLSPDFDENEFISKKMSVLRETAPENFTSDIFCDYKSNLYSLDNISGEIIKYISTGDLKWAEPKVWIKSDSLIEAKSIIIDGGIWILNKDNSISRYYAGNLQKTLELNIFPEPKNFSRIFTSETLPYLYILEPNKNRLIIINKAGETIKQYQSEKFDNLSDFAVSLNGKTIHLFNGLKIYQIDIP